MRRVLLFVGAVVGAPLALLAIALLAVATLLGMLTASLLGMLGFEELADSMEETLMGWTQR